MPDVDVAILGGGCAGLSLAMRLARTDLSFRVVEPRLNYTDDRSWSFWRVAPHPFEDAVAGSWSAWSVEGPNGVVRRGSSRSPYQTLRGATFYDRAQEVIQAAPRGELSLGVRAISASPGAPSVIDCSDGGFSAHHVIDTRPPEVRPTYGQFFLGREIRTDAAVFDPGCVQLMHFRSGYSAGVDFLYVLPFAADHALVEVTSFAPLSPSYRVFDDWLTAECARLAGRASYQSIRQEAGALPMQVGFRAPDVPGIVHLGLAGGAARPSTGYAFQRIQSQSLAVAAQLAAGEPPRPPIDGRFSEFMDGLFLRVLQDDPSRAPELFESLFANASPDRLARFLSGSTRTSDRGAIVAALPPRPFLSAALGRGARRGAVNSALEAKSSTD